MVTVINNFITFQMSTVSNIVLLILIVGCTTVVSKYITDEAQKIYDGTCRFLLFAVQL